MFCFGRKAWAGRFFSVLLVVVFAAQFAKSHPAEEKSTSRSPSTSSRGTTSTSTTTTSTTAKSSSTTFPTTTDKPVRHPTYVRLLNRKGKGSNGTDSATAESRIVKTNTTDPLAVLASGRQNLTVDEIKNIVPYLDFTTEPTVNLFGGRSNKAGGDRPRGLSGLLSLLRVPFQALQNFGNRTSVFSSRISNKNGTNPTTTISSNKNSAFGSSANSILAVPGRFIANVMKMMQNMTLTFGEMMQNLLKLFNSNGGGRSTTSFSLS